LSRCDFCGDEIVHPFNCNYCEGSFCKEHRLPPNHKCSGLDKWKDQSGPSIRLNKKRKSLKSKKEKSISLSSSVNQNKNRQSSHLSNSGGSNSDKSNWSNVKKSDKGNGWSKRGIVEIGIIALLVLGLFHINFSLSKPEYEVNGNINNQEILSGEELTVNAQIKNISEVNSPILRLLQNREGIYNVFVDWFVESKRFTLKVDGDPVERREVRIGPGGSENINFTLVGKERGNCNVQIGDFTENFSVENSAKFELNEIQIDPWNPWVGENISFSHKVRNEGFIEDEKTIELDIDDKVKSKELNLSPGEEKTVSFSIIIDEKDNYEVKISDGVEEVTEKFSVSTPADSPFSRSSYYYGFAEEYTRKNFDVPQRKNIDGLASFLNEVELPTYEEGVFDCSDSSAVVEWLLEGAGFNTYIGSNDQHTWVIVKINGETSVAVEATLLTEGDYRPPGIVMGPNGEHKKYSWIYKMFQDWKEKYPPSQYAYDADITLEEWKEEYMATVQQPVGIPSKSGYYSPLELYNSPKPMHQGTESGSYMPISEFDWWNVSPYNEMNPFSSWD